MNRKAISALTLIILMLVSAVIGGIIAYMLTIAYYVEIEYNIPENETTLAITDILLDPKHVDSFTIKVLNPSYSVSEATVTAIALSVEGEDALYKVVQTSPNLTEGIQIQVGQDLEIKCEKIQMGEDTVSVGRFLTEFPGKIATVYVLCENASAANRQFVLPSPRLDIRPEFKASVSVNNFTLIIRNVGKENLTINYVSVGPIELTRENTGLNISSGVLIPVGKTLTVNCSQKWLGVFGGSIRVHTVEGYEFVRQFKAPRIEMLIENVLFNENVTSSFSVTLNVTTFQTQTYGYLDITSASLKLDNGNELNFNQSERIGYNSSLTLQIPWNWIEYRGREFNLTIRTSQGITAAKQHIRTPDPIILKILNKESIFSLQNRKNVTIIVQNHPSSLAAVNITQITIEEMVINITSYIEPSDNATLYCTLGKDWTEYNKDALRLVIKYEYLISGNLTEASASFDVPLPKKAELKIVSVNFVKTEPVNYLNITIENMPYSLWNLTIINVTINMNDGTNALEKQWSPGLIVLAPNQSYSLIFEVGKEDFTGVKINIVVTTSEGVEGTWSGTPS